MTAVATHCDSSSFFSAKYSAWGSGDESALRIKAYSNSNNKCNR